MAQISINNGNTYSAVESLTNEEVANVLAAGQHDQEIADLCAGDNDREWLAEYVERHAEKHGKDFVVS